MVPANEIMVKMIDEINKHCKKPESVKVDVDLMVSPPAR